MAWLMSGAPSALVTALWKSASWAGVAAPDIAREGELVAVLGLPGLCQEVAPPVSVPQLLPLLMTNVSANMKSF